MTQQSLQQMVQEFTQGSRCAATRSPEALLDSLRPEAERARVALVFLAAAQLNDIKITEDDTNDAILEEMANGKAVQRLRVEYREGRSARKFNARPSRSGVRCAPRPRRHHRQGRRARCPAEST